MALENLETPGTGALLQAQGMGRFLCGMCDSPLFGSEDRVPGADDYVTFTAPLHDQAVTTSATYTPEGETQSIIHCATCKATIGFMSDLELRSADDLEQGEKEIEYKISSNAVRFKKYWSFRNYPVGALAILCILGVGSYMAWQAFESLRSSEGIGTTSSQIELWLGEVKIRATPVVLEEANVNGSIPAIESGTLLLVIPPNSAAIRVRLANTQFDLLWLDTGFKTLTFEAIDPSRSDLLTPPDNARFALVALPGTIPPFARTYGYEIFVINKSNLF